MIRPTGAELTAEDYAILDSALESVICKLNDPEVSIIVSPTMSGERVASLADEVPTSLWHGQEREELENLFQRSRVPRLLEPRLSPTYRYSIVSQDTIDAIFDAAPGQDDEWDLLAAWKRFHGTYPSARHLIEVAAPGIDSTGRYAVVYVQRADALVDRGPVSDGHLVLLEKVDGRWVEREFITAWSS